VKKEGFSISGPDSVRISKLLSYVLRHAPESIGLTLTSDGWVDVNDLLEACGRAGHSITREQLQSVVETSDKQRFSFSEDGSMIRANQGHSTNVDLALAPLEPPATLYHGTATRFIESIMKQGLIKGKRHHVHLSESIETASAVGQRYGKLQLLKIDAGEMHRNGFKFFKSANGVWLTESVPSKYIRTITTD
jgi:putative RNA 2'-phosphotransferase